MILLLEFLAAVTDPARPIWADFLMPNYLTERKLLPTIFAVELFALLAEVPCDKPLRHSGFAAKAFFGLLTCPLFSFQIFGDFLFFDASFVLSLDF